jgi:hypothetical protein
MRAVETIGFEVAPKFYPGVSSFLAVGLASRAGWATGVGAEPFV